MLLLETPVMSDCQRAVSTYARDRRRGLGLPMILASVVALGACGGGGGDAEPNASQPVEALAADDRLEAQAAVVLNRDVVLQLRSAQSLSTLLRTHRLSVIEQFGTRPIYRVRPASGVSRDAAIARLRSDAAVLFAEAVADTASPEARRGNRVWAIGGDAGVYASQWAPAALRLGAAHSISRGDGIRIAILDTGADLSHPALASRWSRSPTGQILGRDFVSDDADPSEVGGAGDGGFGHGTHVAGLAALTAPGARLMPVRVLDASGRGNTWVLAEALGWVVDPDGNPLTDDGAHVINLSLGTTTPTQLLNTIVSLVTCTFDDDDDDFADAGFNADRARCAGQRGAVVVAAAGNGGNDTEFQYPAAEDVKGVLSVTASTQARRLAAFANRGSWIGISAPGENIVSTVPGSAWGVWSGTSMASPLVAGSAALLMATRPLDGDPSLPVPRQWSSERVTIVLRDRASSLCGTSMRQVDAAAAVSDTPPPDVICP
jgi:subtilisin family serine protease